MRPRLLVLLLLAAGCGGSAASAPPVWSRPGLEGAVRPEMGAPQPGDPAPPFELTRSDGGTYALEDARGKWVLVHFTATFCPYCDVEIEHLSRLAEDMADAPLEVLLVDVAEPAATWRAYAAERVRSPRVVLLEDATGEMAARYAPERAQPSFEDRAQVVLAGTVVIDPEGTIRLFLLADTRNFDPSLEAVRHELARMMRGEDEGGVGAPAAQPPPTPGAPRSLAPEAVVATSVRDSGPVAPGEGGELVVSLQIAEGYHIMSDRPTSEFHIATTLVLTGSTGVELGAPRFPEATPFALLGTPISTFSGVVEIRIPFTVDPGSPAGPIDFAGTLGYQACTDASCLFPTERSLRHTVTVVAGE